VVHGKGSLLGKMPGDEWQRFANLRLLLAYQMTAPGKKLQFMGAELGQPWEWRAAEELPWYLLQYPLHAGVKSLVRDLNRLYHCMNWIFSPKVFNGSTATTPTSRW
jgi:1,4-alpha-glucan branching enzyme